MTIKDYSKLLAEAVGHHFVSTGAKNYTGEVYTITLDSGGDQFEVVVTTQKVGAKTPHELRTEAEARAESLEADNYALQDKVKGLQELMAQQSEVEACYEHAQKAMEGEAARLRAQLAERDALCAPLAKIFQGWLDDGRMPAFSKGDVRQIIKALSASAEPSAPATVIIDEPDDFTGDLCPFCCGSGLVATGITESPSTICETCEGTGKTGKARDV